MTMATLRQTQQHNINSQHITNENLISIKKVSDSIFGFNFSLRDDN